MSRKRALRQRRRRAVLAAALVVAVAAVGFASISGDRTEEPPPPPPHIDLPEGRVRVEVLNRGGVRGMARSATLLLRDVGFDVVEFGNADRFDADEPSAVVDRVGRTDLARAVADVLGIDNVLSEPDPNLYVDVSVLLGSGWTQPAWWERGGAPAARRAWWDVRRFLNR